MSVATHLGLSDPQQDLLAEARSQWPTWCRLTPALGVVEDLVELPGWTLRATKPAADEALHALATLASPTGGDDVVAAGALAWVLLPGACQVAHRLRSLTDRIDEVVAAQLWLEVRGFRWERRRKVAANILMNTRRGVLRDLGVGEHLREVDPTWARAIPLEPTAAVWGVLEARASEPVDRSAAAELADVLAWSVAEGVITEADVDLLLGLAVAADEVGVTRSGCGQGGLSSRRVVSAVAAQRGLAASTIRRRATTCLHAVAAAYAQIPA